MAETAPVTEPGTTTEPNTTTEDQRVPYERFQQANTKAKEAADRATALEQQLNELRAQMEERETAGLPELERERKRAEQLEKRAAEAEKKAEETERNLTRAHRSTLVRDAAMRAQFDDPSDALRYTEFVDLDAIETADDAERAVKKLAKAKPKLLKDEAPVLPGRVLENGQQATTKANGAHALTEEAQMIADNLKQFLKNRRG